MVVDDCTPVVKAAVVVVMAVRRSFGSAAWGVEMGAVHCCRHSRSLHFQHQTRSMAVLAEDSSIAVIGMADLELDVAAEATTVGMKLDSDKVGMVVEQRDIGLVVVKGLFEHMTVAVLIGNHRRSATAVCHRSLKAQHCPCSSFRQMNRWARRTECLGTSSTWAVVWEREDRTWHRPGCTCSKVSPRACGHSIERQMRV